MCRLDEMFIYAKNVGNIGFNLDKVRMPMNLLKGESAAVVAPQLRQ